MSQWVLTPLAYLLSFAGAVGLLYSLLHHFRPRLAGAFHRRVQQVGASFDELYFSRWKPTTFVSVRWLGAPVAAAVVQVATRSWVFALLVGLAVLVLPGKWLAWKLQTRREKLESQIVDFISSLIATTKSGMNLQMSLAEVAGRLPAPMSQECQTILRRIEGGQSVRAALVDADRRLQSARMSLVFHSLVVHERSGGRLPELLDRIARSLREIERVEERVKTETSGIRLAARLMVAMPVFIGGLLYLLSPEQVTMLFDTPIGNLMLATAIVLDYVAFQIIYRLSDLEI